MNFNLEGIEKILDAVKNDDIKVPKGFNHKKYQEGRPLFRRFKQFFVPKTLKLKSEGGERLKSLLLSLNSKVKITNALGSDKYQGKFESGEDVIYIRPKEDIKDETLWVMILAHETIHWTGKRLERPFFIRWKRKANSRPYKEFCFEECVAQLGAYILMDHFGIADKRVYADTVKYLKKYDGKIFVDQAAIKAMEAVEYIFDWTKRYA